MRDGKLTGIGLLFAVSIPHMAISAPNAYECQVKAVYYLGESGRLKEQTADGLVDTRFMVDRDSGVIIGQYAVGNARAGKVQVLNRGSDVNSFKAIWFTAGGDGGAVSGALEVREFSTGPNKPFLYSAWPGYLTGICR